MDGTQVIIMGAALAFNVLVIKHKLEKKRTGDAILDGAILIVLSLGLSQSLGGMQITTVASAIISVSLWFFPPKQLFSKKDIEKLKPKKKFKL